MKLSWAGHFRIQEDNQNYQYFQEMKRLNFDEQKVQNYQQTSEEEVHHAPKWQWILHHQLQELMNQRMLGDAVLLGKDVQYQLMSHLSN